MKTSTTLLAATAVLAALSFQQSASAADFWRVDHSPRQARQHWSGRAPIAQYAQQYDRQGYAPGCAARSYAPVDRSRYRRNYVGYGYGRGGYSHAAYGRGGYGPGGYAHGSRRSHGGHGHSLLHLDVGPFHFGLGR